MNCTRKHTLVTSASSGIGRATALRLAAAGQHVYAGIRREADGDQLVTSAAGGEITPVLLDVTEAGQVAGAAAEIGGHAVAGLDGLVNNAGYGLACPVELVPLDAFRRQLDVNVTGQLAVTQAMLPLLRRAGGRIVMVSTIGVRFNPPFAGPLDAAKAALTALADSLRQELAPWGIPVVLVEPASINSGAADKVSRDAAAAMAAASPQGRALYQGTFAAMLEVMNRREGHGSPPEAAAVTIVRALTASRPRTVYLAGKDSRRLAVLSMLGQHLVAGYLTLAVLMVLLALPFVLFTPDPPLAPEHREPFSWRRLASSYWLSPRAHPDFGWAWLTRFLTSLSIAMGTLYLLYFLRDAVHYGRLFPGQTAADGLLILILIYTVCVVIASIIGGIISDRRGRRKMMVTVSGLLMAAAALLLTFLQTWPAALGAALLYGLGYGCYIAVDQALITQVLPAARDRAKDLGIINIAIVCPGAIGAVIAAPLVSLAGYPALFGATALVAIAAAVGVWQIKSVR